MQTPTHSRRSPTGIRLAAILAITLAAALFVTLAWLIVRPTTGGPAADGPTIDGRPATAAASAAATTAQVTEATPPLQRTGADDPAPPTPLATFEELVEQLVTLGMRIAELVQQDEIADAKASDQAVRTTLAQLMERFPDAGERGLAMLAGIAEPSIDARDPGRHIVCKLVIGSDLARRHSAAEAAKDRTRIDPLVQSVLDVMPQASPMAESGAKLIADQPYLRLVHEPGVLTLVRLAGEEKFSRPIATQLLLTLWNNLQAHGERSSEELSRLAMLLLADADPSQRTAACRQLLRDPRYRSLILSWLRERKDEAVASEVAGIAARELPPTDALQVLKELAPVLPRVPGPYIVLGHRAPESLADSYRELLANNTQPEVRGELVTGIGMTPAGLGIEIAQMALQNDPSPAVRLQAVFALTGKPQEDLAERAMQQALDDPMLHHDPVHLGALVLAMQNLEAGGHTNAIDRVGQRMRTMPLSADSRHNLEAILARTLPGGRTSRPAPLPR